MKKLSLLLVSGALLSPLWMSSASAQFAKPEDAIKYRQSAFVVMASQFGRMQSTVKGQVPYDAAAIKANVALVKTLSTLPWGAFGPGTGVRVPLGQRFGLMPQVSRQLKLNSKAQLSNFPLRLTRVI